MKSRGVAACSLLLVVASAAHACAGDHPAFSSELAENVGRMVGARREQLGIPGISAAIALDGQLCWTKGYGLADLENEVPATEKTVYRLASISKPITAIAVMKLAESGKLDLDAPIQKYVPSF